MNICFIYGVEQFTNLMDKYLFSATYRAMGFCKLQLEIKWVLYSCRCIRLENHNEGFLKDVVGYTRVKSSG